ncbi:hypothetical protein OHA98_40225 [Streptomyces sp. NBC_00654]|uniref:hypothetical protein n=1 Tax=Streptomyces sp. NBC_00654 TaxID=2975799 RepID=UPI0022521180|nr:hypothetical protein [Streptomyces sp. NBC_00654]MCX4970866.1 hypothetical protein [Streptomyces sp. NBC_00654]
MVWPPVSADNGPDDGGQLGGHGDDAFPVALGGSNDEQDDDLAVGPLILPDAEMGEFQDLLYAHA